MQFDYAVIGGGVVGLAVAYGLLKQGRSVLCIDGSDGDFRASRGNFGLVWLQGKGLNAPHYARWTQQSIARYPAFVNGLQQETGIDLQYQASGGYEFFLDQASLTRQIEEYEQLKRQLANDFHYEVWDQQRIRAEEPWLGPEVIGATFCPDDGHLNPLQLLRALATACHQMGMTHLINEQVLDIRHPRHFEIQTPHHAALKAKKVVLAAGLGAAELGPKLGFRAPVTPLRGQILVTEKLPKVLNRPSVRVRQVNEGGIQLGDSSEAVGLDDHETIDVLSDIARHAISVLPLLADKRLVRTWGALRVMTPDGLPIYQKSERFKGASLISCHSGISLAAAHASELVDWLEDRPAFDLNKFGESRFDD